jgi:chemotaxis protein MotA
MDLTTLLGLLIGIGGILLGNVIEGGQLSSLVQFAAGVIVLLGTAGATLVSSRKEDLQMARLLSRRIFFKDLAGDARIRQAYVDLMDCARLARKESNLALEPRVNDIQDPFLQKTLRAVVDGLQGPVIRETFEQQIDLEEQNLLAGAKVWSDAGGFAPTIGIIGAVLGLIHVMSNLADTSKLGAGIAVAFVATIYGVGFANLVCIPISNKIKKKIAEEVRLRDMILEGALAIQAGLPPSLVDIKLRAFIPGKIS